MIGVDARDRARMFHLDPGLLRLIVEGPAAVAMWSLEATFVSPWKNHESHLHRAWPIISEARYEWWHRHMGPEPPKHWRQLSRVGWRRR